MNVILSNYANRPASPDKHMCNRKVYDIYRGGGERGLVLTQLKYEDIRVVIIM